MKVKKELVDDGIKNKTEIKVDDKYLFSVNVPYRILKNKEDEIIDIIAKEFWNSFTNDVKVKLKKQIEDMFIVEMRKEKLKKLKNYE